MSHTALTDAERQGYRRRLEEMADRLAGGVSRLEAEALRPTGSEGTAAEPPAHDPVPTSSEGEEDVARAVLLTEDELLAEARAALNRLDHGTFGWCEQCGYTISRQRLEAVPYARLCIRCARAAETRPAD